MRPTAAPSDEFIVVKVSTCPMNKDERQVFSYFVRKFKRGDWRIQYRACLRFLLGRLDRLHHHEYLAVRRWRANFATAPPQAGGLLGL